MVLVTYLYSCTSTVAYQSENYFRNSCMVRVTNWKYSASGTTGVRNHVEVKVFVDSLRQGFSYVAILQSREAITKQK